ncbi:MAG: DUF1508 domain-containing protein, partial [Comamonadaceae bacterium]|nr:DUF1508 domain-containing protein [Comamonadaceae bacterium]
LDGRKMSKSYDNTIPLFVPADELRKKIMGIVTDSRAPGEPKDTEGSALFAIYRAFASDEETAAFARAFADGIAWGDAKQALFERIDREIAPMRARYAELIAHPAEVERILQRGAEKARAEATPYIRQLREAVGLRNLATAATAAHASASSKETLPTFKQYREADGRFYFKLTAADGTVLLQSQGFDNPREAGQAVKRLQSEGPAALADLQNALAPIADRVALEQALARLKAAAEAAQ